MKEYDIIKYYFSFSVRFDFCNLYFCEMRKFEIGDKVSVLDRNIKGEIVSLTVYKAIVLDTDGFEEEFQISKLVVSSIKEDYENAMYNMLVEKEIKTTERISKSHLVRSIKEIDLHMDALSESKNGMTNHEIVMYQLNAVSKAIQETNKKNFSKIVFIHGIGKGKLRYELEILLKKKEIYFQDASFQKYGRGAIEVIL